MTATTNDYNLNAVLLTLLNSITFFVKAVNYIKISTIDPYLL